MEVVDYQAIREDPALRRGLYGLKELASYLSFDHERLAASTVSRWTRRGLSTVEHRARRQDYSFVDLISMFVVRNLVSLGLSLREIRDAESYFRTRYDLEHPFVSVRLKTDGVDVFYEASPAIAEQLTSANRWGQEVLKPAIMGALTGVSYDHGLAIDWTPTVGIVLDPSIQFGEPCIADTRVTTSQIAEIASSSETTPAELAHIYRIDELAVRRALEFERRLSLTA